LTGAGSPGSLYRTEAEALADAVDPLAAARLRRATGEPGRLLGEEAAMRAIHQPTSRTRPRPAKWRHTAARLVALATLLAVIVGPVMGASASSDHGHKGRTIHLHSTQVSSTVNSAGHGGPADVLANLFSFTTSEGVTGHAVISCTLFSAVEELCHATFVFPNGQIDAQAAVALPPTRFTAAVIGGTGVYNGASGQIFNVVTAPGVVDRTIELLPLRKG
jgi:hypothetical protein